MTPEQTLRVLFRDLPPGTLPKDVLTCLKRIAPIRARPRNVDELIVINYAVALKIAKEEKKEERPHYIVPREDMRSAIQRAFLEHGQLRFKSGDQGEFEL